MPPRRSPRGGGSLIQLAPGRWRSQGIDPTGRRRSAVHHVATKREAVEAHSRFMVRIGAEDIIGPGTRTVDDLLDEWWKHHRGELAPTSAYRYSQHIALIRKHLGPVPLARVRPLLLDRFYREPGITAHRATEMRGKILHPAFDRAVDWGWLAENPVKRSRLPKVDRREMRPPSHEDVLAFTAGLLRDGPLWFGVFFHLLAVTGCRKGEVIGLRWDDIDWEAGTVHVRRNVAITPATGVLVKEPKTARGRRTVTVADGTLQLLRGWLTVQPRTGRWLFPGDVAHGDLPLSPNIVDKTFVKARDRYGFPYRMHDIRHAVATTLLSGGVHIRAVADILGHARPEVTLGVYAHALPQDHRAAAELLAGPST